MQLLKVTNVCGSCEQAFGRLKKPALFASQAFRGGLLIEYRVCEPCLEMLHYTWRRKSLVRFSNKVSKNILARAMPRLNLGCGRKHLPNAVNLDITPDTLPDVVHDLNTTPWPFPDNHFAEIIANDVVEHLENPISALEEMHRISIDGARVKIAVPHFSCPNAFHLTHRTFYHSHTFDFLEGRDEDSFYTKARFRVVSKNIIFFPTLLNKIVWRLANRYRDGYERRWAWIFPAWFLSFELEAVKPSSEA